MDDLIRKHFAEEIALVANIQSAALVDAFAAVRREDFLETGPWDVLTIGPTGSARYRRTDDADARHVCHNVAIALDASKMLNNGQPSINAICIDALALAAGERVVHIGCGSGYYTAIMATVAGPRGRVTAYEVEEHLARRAAKNLEPWPNVRVEAASAVGRLRGECDALYVNAGATHLLPEWLDALAPGGRIVAPLTYSASANTVGTGIVMAVRRGDSVWSARPVGPMAVYPCIGARSDAANLEIASALRQGTWKDISRLRREPHDREASCRLHSADMCLAADGR